MGRFAYRRTTIGGAVACARCKTGPVTLLESAPPHDPATLARVGRALDRAASGERLDVADAEALLGATGPDFDRLLELAGAVRDAGLAASGRPGVITYSRKVFVPLTTLCRDRCHYCIFVDTPAQLLQAAQAGVHVARAGARGRAAGRGARLQGGAPHARRPARGPLARGARVARRARLRLDARLRRAHRPAHHRRDRACSRT